MKELSEKTSGFTDSLIRRMTRVANKYDAINLSQGYPDFDPPKEITDKLAEVAATGPHQYATTWGSESIRKALAKKQEHFSGMNVDPDKEIVVTCGGTEAMIAAVLTVCNPGDKVVIFSPFYENYGADAILSGAEPIYVPLIPPDFHFDAAALEHAFSQDGVKAMILCNPSNPCGKVFTREELQIIADLAIKYDLYVITDEVYEHILYKPHEHVYLSTLPGMKERTIICSSLSKTYSITGWRIGYVIASERITERVKKVHDFLTIGAAAPLMEAVTVGLGFGDDYYDNLQKNYTHMKDVFCNGLRDIDLQFVEPQGAYYVMVDISEFGYENDYDFCVNLAEKVGVAAVPGSSFFKEDVNNYIRFHFAKKDETLLKALDRLADIRKKLA